jgi:hypothetical protein
MDLYENTLIGAFLYGLGVEVGSKAAKTPVIASIDLLQQTPLDRSLADVLIAAPRLFRLYEFKRVQNASSKEREKQTGLVTFLEGHPARTELLATSRAIHHHVQIGYAGELPDGSPTLSVSPYIGGPWTNTTLPLLCEDTARLMREPPVAPTPQACARYLAALVKTQGAIKRGSGGGSTLMVALEHGVVQQAHVPDLLDFKRRGRELAARQKEVDRAMATIRERERMIEIEQWKAREAAKEADRQWRTRNDRQLGD